MFRRNIAQLVLDCINPRVETKKPVTAPSKNVIYHLCPVLKHHSTGFTKISALNTNDADRQPSRGIYGCCDSSTLRVDTFMSSAVTKSNPEDNNNNNQTVRGWSVCQWSARPSLELQHTVRCCRSAVWVIRLFTF